MPRPFPVWPRGPRRLRTPSPRLLLACPRISPEWELSTVTGLIKPQTRTAVEHRTGLQRWPAKTQQRFQAALQRADDLLELNWEYHFPNDGEFFFVTHLPKESLDQAKALALVISAAVPDNWFVLGRLFVKERRFFRRRFGYRLEIVPATDVHVPRLFRQQLKELL
jgi:hypothetical protein